MYMHLQEHGCEKYEEYEEKMLKRIEELENFGYQVIKALSPEQYIIRRGHEYVEFKVDSKKQIIEIVKERVKDNKKLFTQQEYDNINKNIDTYIIITISSKAWCAGTR